MSLLRSRLRAEGLTIGSPGRKEPFVVWQFCDGKPGHDNQSTGLIEALSAIRSLETHTLAADPPARAVLGWCARRYARTTGLPAPDLIVGAGHRTHPSMLAARRAHGGRIIVLMKPGLPASWFDLCVIPRHDKPPDRNNVLVTRGVLTRPVPAREKDPDSGLILLGGPSRHFEWNDPHVISQVAAILVQEPDRHWKITGSRRTPPGFQQAFVSRYPEIAKSVAFVQETNPDWLPEQLARSPLVWVTEDSVSMIHEALSARAIVGLIEVPRRGENRITRGIDDLLREGWAGRYEDWQVGKPLPVPEQPLRESHRCAQEIAERWLSDL